MGAVAVSCGRRGCPDVDAARGCPAPEPTCQSRAGGSGANPLLPDAMPAVPHAAATVRQKVMAAAQDELGIVVAESDVAVVDLLDESAACGPGGTYETGGNGR